MDDIDPRKLKEARDIFHELLSHKTDESEWQRFFATYPYVLSLALPLRLDPGDIVPLGRSGKTEPDFVFYPRQITPIPFYGVIELKKPASPIVTVQRENVAIFSRDAETAIEQAKAYSRKPNLWIPAKLANEILFLGNHAYIFVIMGMSKELSQKLGNELYYKMVQDKLPGNLRILPYDFVLRCFEAQVPPEIRFLAPQNKTIITINPHEILDEIMYDFGESLVDSEDVASAIAGTNAYAFGVDEYEVTSVVYDEENDEIAFDASFTLSGEQGEDEPWSGSTVYLQVNGSVSREDGEWDIREYTIDSCKTDFDGEDDERYDIE